jgi:hypothetical protein
MASLFNEYEALTQEALQLSNEVENAVKPLIASWTARGYAYREIGTVIIDTVAGCIAEGALLKGLASRRRKREAAQQQQQQQL